ncbi:DUF1360 domain-containing protein [Metabacillus fastidiosus]|uniref:DUF1360 domain-containing protein n=1 Tax=Metabacillus fastidiosus TaxID=1458 RepID=UPI003D28670F
MLTFLQFFIFSLAVFRLTRLIVYDKITQFIRNPFHYEIEEVDEDGNIETYIEIKGKGLRAWIGELLSCYWCMGIWCSVFLLGLWYMWPTAGNFLLIILAIAGLAGIIEAIVTRLIDK